MRGPTKSWQKRNYCEDTSEGMGGMPGERSCGVPRALGASRLRGGMAGFEDRKREAPPGCGIQTVPIR